MDPRSSHGRRTLLRQTLSLAALAALAALGTGALAQPAWPSKTIELVVPYPPGGSTDVVARMLAAKIGPVLGQSVLVDNRPGGNGNIGTAYVARSPADGHRLLMSTSALVTINPHVHKNPGFDPFKDFVPVSMISNGALALAVNAQSSARTLQDVINLARKEPKGLFYATPSSGTPQHLMGELVAQAAGIQLTPVHYKGIAPALNDLIGGNVELIFSTYAALKPQVDGGKVRVLAVAESRRMAVAPSIPTFSETLPGFEMTTWFGIFAPAGTPAPVLARLQQALTQAISTKDAQDLLNSLALPPGSGTGAELGQVLRADYDRLGKLIRDKGITGD